MKISESVKCDLNYVLPEKELAIGKSWIELICLVANLMNLGYEPKDDSYTTTDGYICQPMIFIEGNKQV